MQFVRELADLDTSALCAHLKESTQPFEISQLYDAAAGKKYVDEAERSSSFRAIKDDAKLFQIAERLVEQISASDDHHRCFSLVRNDVTHIVYKQGDFFRKHEDYLAVTSNLIEEYTLIICVTPEERLDGRHAKHRRTRGSGGQTVVYTHGEILTSQATTTPRCGLLFRKDLPHEALRLESGEKHIVSLNLWATRATKAQERILLVCFHPQPPSKQRKTADGDAGRTHLRSVANERSYAIAESKVAQYTGSMLAGLIIQAGDERIVRHECTICSYEEFGAVFKVLNNAHISLEELSESATAIDFYGLPSRNLLVDLSKNGDDVPRQNPGEVLREFIAKPWHSLDESIIMRELHARVPSFQGMEWEAFNDAVHALDVVEPFALELLNHLDAGMLDSLVEGDWRARPPAVRTVRWLEPTAVREESSEDGDVISGDGDVIVCSSLERTIIVSAEARAHSLPYIPFRCVPCLVIRSDT